MNEINNNSQSEKAVFDIIVPFNSDVMVKARKNYKLKIGIVLLIVSGLFLFLAYLSTTSRTPNTAITIFIAIFGGLGLIGALMQLLTLKANSKDNYKKFQYLFYEDSLHVYFDEGKEVNNKTRRMVACLYEKYSNKQYITKVTETSENFDIRVFTGTYNGIAQKAAYYIPKSAFVSAEALNSFKDFLSKKVSNYVTKK